MASVMDLFGRGVTTYNSRIVSKIEAHMNLVDTQPPEEWEGHFGRYSRKIRAGNRTTIPVVVKTITYDENTYYLKEDPVTEFSELKEVLQAEIELTDPNREARLTQLVSDLRDTKVCPHFLRFLGAIQDKATFKTEILLENYSAGNTFRNLKDRLNERQLWSVFQQGLMALAAIQYHLKMSHGHICDESFILEFVPQETVFYEVSGYTYSVQNCGLLVKLIDFSLADHPGERPKYEFLQQHPTLTDALISNPDMRDALRDTRVDQHLGGVGLPSIVFGIPDEAAIYKKGKITGFLTEVNRNDICTIANVSVNRWQPKAFMVDTLNFHGMFQGWMFCPVDFMILDINYISNNDRPLITSPSSMNEWNTYLRHGKLDTVVPLQSDIYEDTEWMSDFTTQCLRSESELVGWPFCAIGSILQFLTPVHGVIRQKYVICKQFARRTEFRANMLSAAGSHGYGSDFQRFSDDKFYNYTEPSLHLKKNVEKILWNVEPPFTTDAPFESLSPSENQSTFDKLMGKNGYFTNIGWGHISLAAIAAGTIFASAVTAMNILDIITPLGRIITKLCYAIADYVRLLIHLAINMIRVLYDIIKLPPTTLAYDDYLGVYSDRINVTMHEWMAMVDLCESFRQLDGITTFVMFSVAFQILNRLLTKVTGIDSSYTQFTFFVATIGSWWVVKYYANTYGIKSKAFESILSGTSSVFGNDSVGGIVGRLIGGTAVDVSSILVNALGGVAMFAKDAVDQTTVTFATRLADLVFSPDVVARWVKIPTMTGKELFKASQIAEAAVGLHKAAMEYYNTDMGRKQRLTNSDVRAFFAKQHLPPEAYGKNPVDLFTALINPSVAAEKIHQAIMDAYNSDITIGKFQERDYPSDSMPHFKYLLQMRKDSLLGIVERDEIDQLNERLLKLTPQMTPFVYQETRKILVQRMGGVDPQNEEEIEKNLIPLMNETNAPYAPLVQAIKPLTMEPAPVTHLVSTQKRVPLFHEIGEMIGLFKASPVVEDLGLQGNQWTQIFTESQYNYTKYITKLFQQEAMKADPSLQLPPDTIKDPFVIGIMADGTVLTRNVLHVDQIPTNIQNPELATPGVVNLFEMYKSVALEKQDAAFLAHNLVGGITHDSVTVDDSIGASGILNDQSNVFHRRIANAIKDGTITTMTDEELLKAKELIVTVPGKGANPHAYTYTQITDTFHDRKLNVLTKRDADEYIDVKSNLNGVATQVYQMASLGWKSVFNRNVGTYVMLGLGAVAVGSLFVAWRRKANEDTLYLQFLSDRQRCLLVYLDNGRATLDVPFQEAFVASQLRQLYENAGKSDEFFEIKSLDRTRYDYLYQQMASRLSEFVNQRTQLFLDHKDLYRVYRNERERIRRLIPISHVAARKSLRGLLQQYDPTNMSHYVQIENDSPMPMSYYENQMSERTVDQWKRAATACLLNLAAYDECGAKVAAYGAITRGFMRIIIYGRTFFISLAKFTKRLLDAGLWFAEKFLISNATARFWALVSATGNFILNLWTEDQQERRAFYDGLMTHLPWYTKEMLDATISPRSA